MPLDSEPSRHAIIGFAMMSIVYVFTVLPTLLYVRRDLKLIAAGILTAVAAIGYAGVVAGGAVVVAPTLIKVAVLLILGGIATQFLNVPGVSAAEEGTDE